MRICFVTFGNITNHPTMKRATGMAGPLLAMGHQVGIVLERAQDNQHRVEEECPQAECLWFERKSASMDRKVKRQLVEQWNADVVWCCGLGFRNWIRPHRSESSPIYIMDHVELVSSFNTLGTGRRLWELACEWFSLFAFDAHFCASRYLNDLFQSRLRRLRLNRGILYTPYAFSKSWFERPRHASSRIKQRFGDSQMILYMGAFWENYGFLDIIYAFKNVADLHPKAHLVMIGSGPEKDRGQSLIEELSLSGRVTFPGYVPEDELTSWFENASVFLCPLRDTVQDKARCPSKLFMYLPFRKPIVTCAVGEAKVLLGKDYPFYFKERDVADLSGGLRRAMGATTDRIDLQLPATSKHSWEARAVEFDSWLKGFLIPRNER